MVVRFNEEPIFYGAAKPRHKKLVPYFTCLGLSIHNDAHH